MMVRQTPFSLDFFFCGQHALCLVSGSHFLIGFHVNSAFPTHRIQGGHFNLGFALFEFRQVFCQIRKSIFFLLFHELNHSKKIFHAGKRPRDACSNTASTWAFWIPGNHSRKSSIRAPSSIFSKSADTGTRVLRNTQAPLTLPGDCSTA